MGVRCAFFSFNALAHGEQSKLWSTSNISTEMLWPSKTLATAALLCNTAGGTCCFYQRSNATEPAAAPSFVPTPERPSSPEPSPASGPTSAPVVPLQLPATPYPSTPANSASSGMPLTAESAASLAPEDMSALTISTLAAEPAAAQAPKGTIAAAGMPLMAETAATQAPEGSTAAAAIESLGTAEPVPVPANVVQTVPLLDMIIQYNQISSSFLNLEQLKEVMAMAAADLEAAAAVPVVILIDAVSEFWLPTILFANGSLQGQLSLVATSALASSTAQSPAAGRRLLQADSTASTTQSTLHLTVIGTAAQPAAVQAALEALLQGSSAPAEVTVVPSGSSALNASILFQSNTSTPVSGETLSALNLAQVSVQYYLQPVVTQAVC